MTALSWGAPGQRFYEAGTDRGVLYVDANPGVAWNGLKAVNEDPSGGTSAPLYQDGQRFHNGMTLEEFNGSIEAFTSPPEFDVCDGMQSPYAGLVFNQQARKPFNLSYRTLIGNDVDGTDHGYKIHLVYNITVESTKIAYATTSQTPSLVTFTWNITTKPMAIPGYKPTAHITVDTTTAPPLVIDALESILYGDGDSDPRFPALTELMGLFSLTVIDNEDGTWTAIGEPEFIYMLDDTTFEINWPTAVNVPPDSFTISS